MTCNNVDPHIPLISALTTFYTLLVDLRYVHPSWLIVPSAETGRHPPNSINEVAARQNGFNDSIIDLAYRIPYITDDDVHLHSETVPLRYLTRVKGEIQPLETDEERDEDLAHEWEYARDPTFQERDDMWTGSNILVLTRGHVYGTELLYDVDKQTIRPHDYTVAWICALPLEMAAAEAMLDERHPELPTHQGDDNTYIGGRVGSHNVIIACLPAGVYGTTSAATVASQMRLTFKSIRFGLMVGIAGGVPSADHDIRLGDVVVSRPTRDSGGVIQYDYGKTVSGGQFERTGVLNKPPPVLLTAMARLQAAHMTEKSCIPDLIADMAMRHPHMTEKFTYDSAREDLLFKVQYDHTHPATTCDGCDRQQLVTRAPREGNDPVIHYGLIASGNQVIKDGRTRDRLARELGILCFEMEAAGLVDSFPCLVIRGICDYADSHKNKQWQEYAAATAAGYAKELLSVVHAVHLAETPSAVSVTDVVHSSKTLSKPRGPSTWLIWQTDDLDDDTLFRRISTYEHEKVHRRLSRKRLTGTAQWFLDHPDFKAWLVEKKFSRLWCSGKIGSGKTMTASAAIDAAKYRSTEHTAPTVFFYCESDRPDELNGTYILSSLIRQLCEYLRAKNTSCPNDVKDTLNRFFGKKRVVPDFDDLKDVFIQLFYHIPDTVYILDGLDALNPDQTKDLFEFFRFLSRGSPSPPESRILVFSREQLPGFTGTPPLMAGIHRISTTSNVMPDLQTYIDTSVTDKLMSRTLTDNLALLDEAKQTLLKESSGMFLWVYLQLEILWQDCSTDNDIRAALRDLPTGLEETYRRCVRRINFTNPYALRVLQWVSFAARPLHIDELREAVAFDLQDVVWDAGKIPQADVVIGCCANLVAVDPTDHCVRFAHPSVKTYLQKDSASFIPGYPESDKQGQLQCGEFCVAYLSFSNFNLQLVKSGNEIVAVNVADPKLLAGDALASPLARLFRGRGADPRRSTQLQFRQIRSATVPDRSQYKFLDYATTHWTLQTKEITSQSPIWDQFKQLSLCFNETWNFHPWAVGGRSHFSRLHGLFGWAVKEGHMPLLEMAFSSGPDIVEVCNLPLIDERLPALHVASKFGRADVVLHLMPACQVNLQDEEGYTALHHAASKGHGDVVAMLLASGMTRADVPSKTRVTPLWLAASHGHLDVLQILAQRQANIEAKESVTRLTPLHKAAGHGHHAVVELLIDRGAKLESKDAGGRTALSWAIRNGHPDTVQLLLEKGADPDCKDATKEQLLVWAARRGHAAITGLLAANPKTDLNATDKNGLTPLLWAARTEQLVIAKILLERGADLEVRDESSRTPLIWAVFNRDEGLARLLLEKGAVIEAEDKYERTAFFWAVENSHEEMVKLLLDWSGDHAKKERFIDSILSWAAQTTTDGEMILPVGRDRVGEMILPAGRDRDREMILSAGRDREPADKAAPMPTSLVWAVKETYRGLYQQFIERDITVNMEDLVKRGAIMWSTGHGQKALLQLLLGDRTAQSTGSALRELCFGKSKTAQSTPQVNRSLLWAASHGEIDVVRRLLERDTDIEAKDSLGYTALLWAIREGQQNIAQLLVDNGANIHARTAYGETPLWWATGNGDETLVKFLLNRGADYECRDKFGFTPLAWALENEHIQVAKRLVDGGAKIPYDSGYGGLFVQKELLAFLQ
ncbi:hypothetical protein CNMCM5793_003091 [Aspergillus hiratsukae]|uniref:Nucleoside phosphorylase domain-containing protein n=1 Tax=Aspergillus hiratsukae TaxID=1194566 RepID=A0A8H6PE04_9EURO|nr:hypothetical protein CNMCM5793_003091 [Aspergillus hiratsukae]